MQIQQKTSKNNSKAFICVFCGASPNVNQSFLDLAKELGNLFVKNQLGLIYGGGGRGLMGEMAKSVLKNQGWVEGVIPQFLIDLEKADLPLSETHIVQSMHERKAKMFDLADAFIILPGGIGTLEEMFEMFTAKQLQRHQKPIILFNFNGFYDLLIQFLQEKQTQGFLHGQSLNQIEIIDSLEKVIDRINKLF